MLLAEPTVGTLWEELHLGDLLSENISPQKQAKALLRNASKVLHEKQNSPYGSSPSMYSHQMGNGSARKQGPSPTINRLADPLRGKFSKYDEILTEDVSSTKKGNLQSSPKYQSKYMGNQRSDVVNERGRMREPAASSGGFFLTEAGVGDDSMDEGSIHHRTGIQQKGKAAKSQRPEQFVDHVLSRVRKRLENATKLESVLSQMRGQQKVSTLPKAPEASKRTKGNQKQVPMSKTVPAAIRGRAKPPPGRAQPKVVEKPPAKRQAWQDPLMKNYNDGRSNQRSKPDYLRHASKNTSYNRNAPNGVNKKAAGGMGQGAGRASKTFSSDDIRGRVGGVKNAQQSKSASMNMLHARRGVNPVLSPVKETGRARNARGRAGGADANARSGASVGVGVRNKVDPNGSMASEWRARARASVNMNNNSNKNTYMTDQSADVSFSSSGPARKPKIGAGFGAFRGKGVVTKSKSSHTFLTLEKVDSEAEYRQKMAGMGFGIPSPVKSTSSGGILKEDVGRGGKPGGKLGLSPIREPRSNKLSGSATDRGKEAFPAGASDGTGLQRPVNLSQNTSADVAGSGGVEAIDIPAAPTEEQVPLAARPTDEIIEVLSRVELKEADRNKGKGVTQTDETAILAAQLIKHARKIGGHLAAAQSYAAKYKEVDLDDV